MNMDRFKFRVWNKTAKQLYEPPLGRLEFYLREMPDTFEFMQCTGLKDSEGTLIWEGDVVEMSDFQIEKLNGSGLIYWSDDGGMWMYRKGGEGGLPAILHKVNDYLKVLGNIYEHPSLLEVER